MSAPFKPNGYTSVSPYLITTDVQQIVTFLNKTFGATVLRRFESPEGRTMHCEVKLDDSIVMLGESPEGSASPAHIHLYVQDVQDAYRRALEAGGKSVQEPQQRGGEDTDMRGGVEDPGGNTWWISTQMTAG